MLKTTKPLNAPILYVPNFVELADYVFKDLLINTNWLRWENSNRSEYYSNLFDVPYTYGRGTGRRTYAPMRWTISQLTLLYDLKLAMDVDFDVCFMNAYQDKKDALDWHSDDSPEMDDNKPIAIISLGAEREIWFKPINGDEKSVERLLLQHGSLCIMSAGMQDTHRHKIPRGSKVCGPRVSLTYRGYVHT